MKHRVLRVLGGLSRFLNLLLFFGDRYTNMSICARACLRRKQGHEGWAVVEKVLNLIFLPFEREHCSLCYRDTVADAYKVISRYEAGRRKP